MTAGARAFEVVVLTFGIVIGVTTVLSIGNRIGLPIAVSLQDLPRPAPGHPGDLCGPHRGGLRHQCLCPGRAVAMSAVLGVLGWVVATTLETNFGFSGRPFRPPSRPESWASWLARGVGGWGQRPGP